MFAGHLAHVILHLRTQGEPVGVVSGIFRSTARDAIIHSAQIMPHEISLSTLISIVPASVQCVSRNCQGFVGDLPLTEQSIAIHSLCSLVLKFFRFLKMLMTSVRLWLLGNA